MEFKKIVHPYRDNGGGDDQPGSDIVCSKSKIYPTHERTHKEIENLSTYRHFFNSNTIMYIREKYLYEISLPLNKNFIQKSNGKSICFLPLNSSVI